MKYVWTWGTYRNARALVRVKRGSKKRPPRKGPSHKARPVDPKRAAEGRYLRSADYCDRAWCLSCGWDGEIVDRRKKACPKCKKFRLLPYSSNAEVKSDDLDDAREDSSKSRVLSKEVQGSHTEGRLRSAEGTKSNASKGGRG